MLFESSRRRVAVPRQASPALFASAALVAALGASCASSPVPPQTSIGTNYGPIQGESELTFGGSLGVTNSSFDVPGASSATEVSLNGQVGYGRYLTNEHEVGGQFIFNLINPDEGDDLSQIGLLPYYRYNVRQSDRTWFYGGVHLGFQQLEAGGESDTSLSYGIHGGMKSWLTPDVSFFVEPRLTFSEFDFGPVSLDQTDFRTLIGFSYTF